MNRLHVYARALRCKALVLEVIQLAAARVEVEAWERSHEARCSAEIVEERADA